MKSSYGKSEMNKQQVFEFVLAAFGYTLPLSIPRQSANPARWKRNDAFVMFHHQAKKEIKEMANGK